MAEQMILAIVTLALLAGAIVGDALDGIRRGGANASSQDEDFEP